MWPTLYTQKTAFGEMPYNTWGLLVTTGFAIAAIIAHRRAARVGIDPDKMVGLYVIAIVAGLAGSRLLHFLMAKDQHFWSNPLVFFDLTKGGFAFYGGLIAGVIGGVLYGHLRGMNIWKLCDAAGPTVMVGQAIGRIGCFFAGCCHGMVFTLPPDAVKLLPDSFSGGQIFFFHEVPFFGVITRHGVGENNVPVYPTQLYETFADLCIFAITSWLFYRRKFDGMVIAAVLMLYSIWRPFNESLRGDDIRGAYDVLGLHLTTSQLVAIPVFLTGLLIAVFRFRKPVAPETPFTGDEGLESHASVPRI
jgi:phosphatidylglycerol:prolipoprotein diacylglycerol transferase